MSLLRCFVIGLVLATVVSCGGSGGGGGTPSADMTSTPASSTISISYNCSDAGQGNVTLKKEAFGISLSCTFSTSSITIDYERDNYTYKIFVPASIYQGPGTYKVAGCSWTPGGGQDTQARVIIPNCQELTAAGGCCELSNQPNYIDCTIVITEHTASQVSGTLRCTVQRADERLDIRQCTTGPVQTFQSNFTYLKSDCAP